MPLSDTVFGPRTLIAGTPSSASQLMAGLALLDPTPVIVGQALTSPRSIQHANPEADAKTDTPVIAGVRSLQDLPQLIQDCRPEQVLVSLPKALNGTMKQLAQQLDDAGIAWRAIPTLTDQLAGVGSQGGAGNLDLGRLLDRPPHARDEAALRGSLAGKRVMITGAGGSIGGELARQVAMYEPTELILVERAENSLFEIDRQMGFAFPDLPRVARLHDVTQADATVELCEQEKPDVVFHAAAHKHVPVMEDHPAQAVENNFYGTRSIVDAAITCGAERMVMISTDKAVNPSSVMGATKRLAELYVADADARSRTTCSMVRFGNVLGSACSVLPIWGKQLSDGGPITVTDERMTRYFMTIPEAASLVMQAGAYAEGGEVFLLDMGEPIRILEMAERFIQAHGLIPGSDVQIKITGARPGEKLFEELAYGGEDMLATPHEAIRIWKSAAADRVRIHKVVETFDRMRWQNGFGRAWAGASKEQVVTALRAAIPEMVEAIAG